MNPARIKVWALPVQNRATVSSQAATAKEFRLAVWGCVKDVSPSQGDLYFVGSLPIDIDIPVDTSTHILKSPLAISGEFADAETIRAKRGLNARRPPMSRRRIGPKLRGSFFEAKYIGVA